ncbi:MAG: hypothetical protein ACOZB0_04980 [Pseudomonadota bacterium]
MTEPAPALALKLVLALLIGLCLALIVTSLVLAVAGHWLPLVAAALLWAPLAWGLWRRKRLARRVAVVLLWWLVLVLPIGVINPFAAMDGAIDPDTPLWHLALPVFGVVAIALLALHVLIKYRSAFGRDGRA